MTDIQAIKERVEKVRRGLATAKLDFHALHGVAANYVVDIPMLLKALAEAEGKLEAIEEVAGVGTIDWPALLAIIRPEVARLRGKERK